jgi:hypothetical protein
MHACMWEKPMHGCKIGRVSMESTHASRPSYTHQVRHTRRGKSMHSCEELLPPPAHNDHAPQPQVAKYLAH